MPRRRTRRWRRCARHWHSGLCLRPGRTVLFVSRPLDAMDARQTRVTSDIITQCLTLTSSTSAPIPPTRSARAPSAPTRSLPWRRKPACRPQRSPTRATCLARWSFRSTAQPRAFSRSSAARSLSPAPTTRAYRPTRWCCSPKTPPAWPTSSVCRRSASWRPTRP
jgi:hypothetical protein